MRCPSRITKLETSQVSSLKIALPAAPRGARRSIPLPICHAAVCSVVVLPFPCDLRSFHTSPDELLIGNNLSVMAVSERLAALAARSENA